MTAHLDPRSPTGPVVPFPRQVVVERPGELIPRCFWLLTSMPADEVSAEELLAL